MPANREFDPFSILTGHLGDLGGGDSAYIGLREHFITVAMEGGDAIAQRRGPHQHRAGTALKPLINLAMIDMSSVMQLDTERKGIEVHPGRGISFVDPPKLVAAAEAGLKPNTIPVKPLFVDYARNLTAPSEG